MSAAVQLSAAISATHTEKTMKALALALALIGVPHPASAADPFVGTYKLNVAKSATSGGQLPPDLTLTISEEGTNLLIATSGKSADGSPISADVLVVPKSGGTIKAPAGERNYDSTVVSRTNPNTIDLVALQKGKERTRVKFALSRDGRTLTRSFTSTNAQGRPMKGTSVLERE
jgi:hypothetical protein